MMPAIYIDWRYWGLRYSSEHYRLCEASYRYTQVEIGPLSLEWTEWI